MQTYFNGQTFRRAVFNGTDLRRIYCNNVMVWQRDIPLFENGAFGEAGGMGVHYTADGGVGSVQVQNGRLRFQGMQNVGFFLDRGAVDCAGMSQLNFTLGALDHQGEHIYIGYTTDGYGPLVLAHSVDLHNHDGSTNTYSVLLGGAGRIWPGVQLVAPGKQISVEFTKIWIS